jgi:hypothetical protein
LPFASARSAAAPRRSRESASPLSRGAFEDDLDIRHRSGRTIAARAELNKM